MPSTRPSPHGLTCHINTPVARTTAVSPADAASGLPRERTDSRLTPERVTSKNQARTIAIGNPLMKTETTMQPISAFADSASGLLSSTASRISVSSQAPPA